jgi:hypothetical protein
MTMPRGPKSVLYVVLRLGLLLLEGGLLAVFRRRRGRLVADLLSLA